MASSNTPGRFLPGDPRTAEPYRLTPQLAFRVAILAFLALAVFALLFLRLWALEVLSGDRYLAQANDNRVRSIRVVKETNTAVMQDFGDRRLTLLTGYPFDVRGDLRYAVVATARG